MKKRKNKMPAFIPNQFSGIRNEAEIRKQKENQKKLMLNNKNNRC